MKLANWIGFEAFPTLVLIRCWKARDPVALEQAMEGRPGQVRDRVLQGIKTVIQRQQRMLAKRNTRSFLRHSEHSRAGIFPPHWLIFHADAFLPFHHGFGVDVITLAQRFDGFIRFLNGRSCGVSSRGAAM